MREAEIVSVEETGSTNDDLKAYVRSVSLEVPRLLVARRQTSGRGTRGRRWVTDDTSLTFSIALPMETGGGPLTLQPLAAGIGVCRVLRMFGVNAFVKWPNDIWFDGGKAGGILCESLRDAAGEKIFIAGIGLNAKAGTGKTTHGWPMTGLGMNIWQSDAGKRAVLVCFADVLTQICTSEWAQITALWPQFDAFLGKKIYFQTDTTEIHGTVLGMDETGRLLLRHDGLISAFTSGNFRYDNPTD